MVFRKATIALSLLATGFISTASATVIDFNSATGNPNGYTDQGVTFSNISATTASFTGSPTGSQAIVISGNDISAFRADIGGGASSVSVDLGDFNSDPDRIFLSVFDSLNNILNTVTFDLASSFSGMETLSVTAANIAYATFGTTGDLGLGGIFVDNFTFEAASVPEPAVIGLMGLGLAAFGLRRRRTVS